MANRNVVALMAALWSLPLTAAAADKWKDTLEAGIKMKYEITKTGFGDYSRITKAGTVFVLQKDGISADLASDIALTKNKVSEGQIAGPSGKATFLLGAGQDKNRVLKSGQKVFLYKVDVKDDEVQYYVVTCDTFEQNVEGSTKQTRYKALVAFEFQKGSLATMDADAVKKAADAVMMPESEAAAASTKTIGLGQTREQVEAILGRPERIVDLGSKVTYVYKDMKVIFVDGKVADVQ